MKSVLEKAEAEEKSASGEDSGDVQDFKIDGDSVKVDGMATENKEEESDQNKKVAPPKVKAVALAQSKAKSPIK